MTSGFGYNNGLESVVCADSRVTAGIRESNTSNKLVILEHDNFYGVIYSAGDKNITEGIFKMTPSWD